MSAHWAGGQQNVLEEEGGIHTADLVAPMLCGEVEDEDDGEEASAAADLVTLAVEAQASHLLAWAYTAKKDKRLNNITTNKTSMLYHVIFCKLMNIFFLR